MDTVEALSEHFRRFKQGLAVKYEPHIRKHLAKVYMILGATCLLTAIGALAQVLGLLDMGILAVISTSVLILSFYWYEDGGKYYRLRLGIFLSFGFFLGQTMGTFLSFIVIVNPAIILTTILCTAVTFLSLTFAALLARRGQFLFLGALAISVLNTMGLIRFANLFLQYSFIKMGQLYLGVFVMTALILFDTQLIVEKRRRGNRDAVKHALELFFDILSLFKRLIFILILKNDRKNAGQC